MKLEKEFTNNITIIGSYHSEIGMCNPSELFKIIEIFKPDVIFEELPTNVFYSIYSGRHQPNTVESKAVSAYIKDNEAKHFPVDTYSYDFDKIFSEYELLFQFDDNYEIIFTELIKNIQHYGFKFLNSSLCTKQITELKRLELKILTDNCSKELLTKYLHEEEIHNKREWEILQNIYNYRITNPFNNAILICGTDHRKGLLEKLNHNSFKDKTMINWLYMHHDE